eukprot:SAG11_NODE_6540_length_1292_cov_2.098072_2_plen_115_part_00
MAGEAVRIAEENGIAIDELSLAQLSELHPTFEADVVRRATFVSRSVGRSLARSAVNSGLEGRLPPGRRRSGILKIRSSLGTRWAAHRNRCGHFLPAARVVCVLPVARVFCLRGA